MIIKRKFRIQILWIEEMEALDSMERGDGSSRFYGKRRWKL